MVGKLNGEIEHLEEEILVNREEYLKLQESHKRLKEALILSQHALGEICKQIPLDEGLADYNFDLAEISVEKTSIALSQTP